MKILDESELTEAVTQNCDGFLTPDEVNDLRRDYKALATVAQELVNYCELKANAMQCREKGLIQMALQFESAGHRIYELLPQWARW